MINNNIRNKISFFLLLNTWKVIKLIKGEKVSVNESGLSKREWNELMTAFDLKEKLI